MRNTLLNSLVTLSICLIAVGCASTTHQYTYSVKAQQNLDMSNLISDPSMGKIYILRKSKFTGSAIAFHISDGGTPIGKVGSKRGVLSWERPPGLCLIGASTPSGQQNVSINVKAGQVYFFEARTTPATFFGVAGVRLQQLQNTVGNAWVKNSKNAK